MKGVVVRKKVSRYRDGVSAGKRLKSTDLGNQMAWNTLIMEYGTLQIQVTNSN